MNEQITSIRLPLQVAPVERTITPTPMSFAGMDPSIDWGNVAKTAIGVGSQLLPILGGLF
jgi:hypothetical protein